MSIRMNKVLRFSFLFMFSLALVACGGGSSKTEFLPEEPEEVIPVPVVVESAAVKGPIANAQVSFYKIDLENDHLATQGHASNQFFTLLTQYNITETDNIVSASSPDDFANLKSEILSYGYVGELSRLKDQLSDVETIDAARTLIGCDYLGVEDGCSTPEETNSRLAADVLAVYNSFATLSQLKANIEALDTIVEEVAQQTTFSAVGSVLTRYQNAESDPIKLEGWTNIIARLSAIQNEPDRYYSVSQVRSAIADLAGQDWGGDSVAKLNIEALEEDLRSIRSLVDAKVALEQFIDEEGNLALKTAVKIERNKITTVHSFIDEVHGQEALYLLEGLETALDGNLQDAYDAIVGQLSSDMMAGMAEAFVSSEIDTDTDEPINFVGSSVSGENAQVARMDFGDYHGFVYMKAEMSSDSVDLTNRQAPLFSEMVSIFHTDGITGRGSNQSEDERRFYIKDNNVLRNSDGSLVDDLEAFDEELDLEDDNITEILPYRFVTPLTTLGVELALDNLYSYRLLKTDVDSDGLIDYRVDAVTLSNALSTSSYEVLETFGNGISSAESVFDAPAMITPLMQFETEDQLLTAQLRASAESFSSFVFEIEKQTNLESSEIIEALVLDMSDDVIDASPDFPDAQVNPLASVSNLKFLASRAPSEVTIPGTTITVDEIDAVLLDETSFFVEGYRQSTFVIADQDLGLMPPVGGVDEDNNGIPDSDEILGVPTGYAGLWSINLEENVSYYPLSLSGELSLTLDVEETEGECANEPCLSIGDLNTDIIANWTVLDGPENHDMAISAQSGASSLGFYVSASVPGDYVVGGNLTTNQPVSVDEGPTEFDAVFSLKLINPRDIELKFSSEAPAEGEIVGVQFKVTDDLCRLYDFCDNLNRSDDKDDFLDISLLSDVFSVSIGLSGSGDSGLQAVKSVNNGRHVVTELNSSNEDNLQVNVTFKSSRNSTEFISASFDAPIGTEQDTDGDGVINKDDAFPNDPLCFVDFAGVVDEDGDGIDDADGGRCAASIVADPANDTNLIETLVVGFLGEEWTYSPEWNYIFRKRLSDNQYLKSVFLLNDSVARDVAFTPVIDSFNRRVYIAFDDHSAAYFDLFEESLVEYLPASTDFQLANLTALERFVLVEYQAPTSFKLFDRDLDVDSLASESQFDFSDSILTPGASYTVLSSNQGIDELLVNLTPKWDVYRNGLDAQPFSPNLSADKLTILEGETASGDIVELSFIATQSGTGDQYEFSVGSYPVLALNSFALRQVSFEVDEPVDFLVSAESIPDGLYVDWFVKSVTDEDYRPIFRDSTFPFELPASNTRYGDVVKAEFFLEAGENDFALGEDLAMVIGEVRDFQYSVVVLGDSLENFGYDLSYDGLSQGEDFSDSFVSPRWYVNQALVQEGGTTFPDGDVNSIAYGSTYSVSFVFTFGGKKFESPRFNLSALNFDINNSTFSLTPSVPNVGENVVLTEQEFSEAVLDGYKPEWSVNDVIDDSVEEYSYPAEKLQFGDKLSLRLAQINPATGETSGEVSDHQETVYIGLDALATGQTLDDDGDGVPNKQDFFRLDANCFAETEGVPDDEDGDGLPDLKELLDTVNGYVLLSSPTRVSLIDSDNDGLSDFEEIQLGLNPNSNDTDGDGFFDFYEVNLSQSDGNDPGDPGIAFSSDKDLDGVLNEDEVLLSTRVDRSDSDLDGILDGQELLLGTDPLNPDSDGDFLSDGAEINVTKSNPLQSDTDGDGIIDGVEVIAATFNPIDSDTNGDGILDSEQLDVTSIDLSNQEVIKSSDLGSYPFSNITNDIPAGTCYASWLAQQEDFNVVSTNTDQEVGTLQEVAFYSYSWPEIIRYDASNRQFTAVIPPQITRGNVSAVEYVKNDASKVYLGYPDGNIRVYDLNTETLTATTYYVGSASAVTKLIDQGDWLIAETQSPDGQTYVHHIFDADVGGESVHTIESPIPYVDLIAIDSDSNGNDDEFYFSSSDADGFALYVERLDETTPGNSDLELVVFSPLQSINSPAFLDESLGRQIIRYGSGYEFDLGTATLSPSLSFEAGLYHQDNRLSVRPSSSLLILDKLITDQSNWQVINELELTESIDLIPVAEDLLVVGKDTNQENATITFEFFSIGDTDGDLIDDWWEELASPSGDINPGDQPDPLFAETYQDLFNGFSFSLNNDSDNDGVSDSDELTNGSDRFSFDVGVDSDGDGISDNQEIAFTKTNPQIADTDGDGISDALEDQDGDGLTALQEATAGTSDLATDTDGDGLSDALELTIAWSDPTLADSDQDGIVDFLEYQVDPANGIDPNGDLDGDSLSNIDELTVYGTDPNASDTDGDGLNDQEEVDTAVGPVFASNPNLTDTDDDGLTDLEESVLNSNPTLVDTDGDGITDYLEQSLSNGFVTDVNNKDSDNDGLEDGVEIELGLSPLANDSDANGTLDGDEDSDSDGLSNFVEVSATNTSPSQQDTDGNGITDDLEDLDADGLSNLAEIDYLFNGVPTPLLPNDPDSDDDGLNDFQESQLASNPQDQDTDGDLISDFDEVFAVLLGKVATSPIASDTDSDGLSDFQELSTSDLNICTPLQTITNQSTDPTLADSDEDGLLDLDEYCLTSTNPSDPSDGAIDSDADGLTDAQELYLTNTDINNTDTDSDGATDDRDDEDRDGLLNTHEVNQTKTDPLLVDSDGNGTDDPDEDFDNDGKTNLEEVTITFTDPLVADSDVDTDGDGISNFAEVDVTGTNPTNADTDNDGTFDGLEDADGDGLTNLFELTVTNTSPNIANSDGQGANDGDEDSDKDGLTNAQELAAQSDPFDVDTDDDGLSDFDEVNTYFTQAYNKDTDADGLSDYEEVIAYGSSPINSDTDGDGLSDGQEVNQYGSDLLAADGDADGLNDSQEIFITLTSPDVADSDGDGLNDGDDDIDGDNLSNFDEVTKTLTDPRNIDTDGNDVNDGEEDLDSDGLTNIAEVSITLTDPLDFDTDADPDVTSDGLNDSDADGLNDSAELNVYGTSPVDADTDLDGLTDYQEILLLNTDPLLVDTDQDGITDDKDDEDADNISNISELNITGTDPLDDDSDGDFILDGNEDSDSDGLTDGQEADNSGTNPFVANTDGLGPNDDLDDTDGDGLTNTDEINLYNTVAGLADTDGDGLNDGYEILTFGSNPNSADSDGDTLPDNFEDLLGLNPNSADSDSNGTSDALEDSDSDGLTNVDEALVTLTQPNDDDTDNDLILDGNEDTDSDGLTDAQELNDTLTLHDNANSTDPNVTDAELDIDGDRLTNEQELNDTNTLPLVADSDSNSVTDDLEDPDGDKLNNYIEVTQTNTDPLVSDSDLDGTSDADEDRDGDGLTDYQELVLVGTDFTVADADGDGVLDANEDADNDGLTNIDELNVYTTNPIESDSDNDGINDSDEVTVYNTSPTNDDTDSDGLNDGDEINRTGTSPLLADSDSNGTNDADEDIDADGLSNTVELNKTLTDPVLADTDLDGTTDAREDFDDDGIENLDEVLRTFTEPNLADTDGNGTSDGDEDRDGDGLSDSVELYRTGSVSEFDNDDTDGDGTLDGAEDTDADGLTDSDEFNLTETDFQLSDSDSNGVTDNLEDPDQDRLNNFNEIYRTNTDPLVADTDDNDVLDGDEDFDSDGLTDAQELQLRDVLLSYGYTADQLTGISNEMTDFQDSDTDGNGTVDGAENSDSDGLTDAQELNLTLTIHTDEYSEDPARVVDDANFDSDGDALSNVIEVTITLTDPRSEDTDSDGFTDGQEDFDGDGVSNEDELNIPGIDLANDDTNSNGTRDGDEDFDADGLTLVQELYITETDPFVDSSLVDTDGDTLTDVQELNVLGTSPLLSDTDSDGLSDAQEINVEGTDPNNPDSDSDGLTDGQEVNASFGFASDPLDSDSDGDGRSDLFEVSPIANGSGYSSDPTVIDTDADGLSDSDEYSLGTNPSDEDTDADGLTDVQEINETLTSPSLPDTDLNDVIDSLEDLDNDGLTNIAELTITFTDPLDDDSDNNGTVDGDEDNDRDEFNVVVGDGLTVAQEVLFGSDFEKVDTDDDNLTDLEEFNYEYVYDGGNTLNRPVKADPTNADTDGDGLSDEFEFNYVGPNGERINIAATDTDEDGLSDFQEINVIVNVDPNNPDSDGDGVLDGDEDFDSDGLTDSQELNLTFTLYDDRTSEDPANLVSDANFDSDGDGLSNLVEIRLGTCVTNADPDCTGFSTDTDQDGLSDFDELAESSSPLLTDTDGDGFSDADEILIYGTDPSSVDSDGDGLNDVQELEIGTSPADLGNDGLSNPLLADTDSDGLTDSEEAEGEYEYSDQQLELFGFPSGRPLLRFDPQNQDTDGDGLSDYYEFIVLGTNPAEADTDNDGVNDFDEVNGSFSELNCRSGSGVATFALFRDTDRDGLEDYEEYCITMTDPTDTDSDDDGILDGDEDTDGDSLTDREELRITLTDPLEASTGNTGTDDSLADSDNDGLTNIQELALGTDPRNPDTDGDGLSDKVEVDAENGFTTDVLNNDSDGDQLPDGEEVNDYGTDPTNPDTDGDGVSDFREVFELNTDPLRVDTDYDLLNDSLDGSPLVADADGDFIPDGVEVLYLLTDPEQTDSDADELTDGQEVWAYILDSEGAILNLGGATGVIFNSKRSNSVWPAPDATRDLSGLDSTELSVIPLTDVEGEPTLYIRRYANPIVLDSDGDGLEDGVEWLTLERSVNNKDPDMAFGTFDPYVPNDDIFVISDPLNEFTDDDLVPDGSEDIDCDFHINVAEQNSDDSEILVYNTDVNEQKVCDSDTLNNLRGTNPIDQIPDGIEALILRTNPAELDTDEDGINDGDEVLTYSGRIDDPANCSDDEIVLDGIDGIDYCISITYLSMPDDADSDNDGVDDNADEFSLDSNCSAASDGKAPKSEAGDPGFDIDNYYCFSTWIAEQVSVDIVESAVWESTFDGTQQQTTLFSPGWEHALRYDSQNQHFVEEILNPAGNIVEFVYTNANARLYYVEQDDAASSIRSVDISSDFSELFVSVDLTGQSNVQLIPLDNSLVLQTESGTGDYVHTLYSSLGDIATVDPGVTLSDFNVSGGYWDASTNRMYGFREVAGQNPQVGYIEIDIVDNAIISGPTLASDNSEPTLAGPITISSDGSLLLFGSGHTLSPDLSGDLQPLAKALGGREFASFARIEDNADYFSAIVDVEVANPLNPLQVETSNAIYVEDKLTNTFFQNKYLLAPESDRDEVLGLFPAIDGELLMVKRNGDRTDFDRVGLTDNDGDDIPGIYENYYGLDDSGSGSEADRFEDPDGDFLSNFEEYLFATDPLLEDTDGDTWSDSYEVLNDTDPTDSASF